MSERSGVLQNLTAAETFSCAARDPLGTREKVSSDQGRLVCSVCCLSVPFLEEWGDVFSILAFFLVFGITYELKAVKICISTLW